MREKLDYEKDIEISCEELDIEWLEQPSLMMKYARIAAEAKRTEEEAKENLELVKAELDLKIRNNPEKFKLAKIVEAAVTNTIIQHPNYIEANQACSQARFENNIASGAVKALDGKKTALENLVKLHGQQYFAGPRVPRDLSWEREQKQKKSNEIVSTKMKRRTR